MKLPIRKKLDCTIPQPLTQKKWVFGYMVDNITAADGRPYALILTEYDEFEYVPHYGIVHEPRFPFSDETTEYDDD